MPSTSPPNIFPTYLLSLPFRRRSSTPSTPSLSTSPSSSNPTPSYLSGHASYLRCSRCLTDLCSTSQIISKGFTGRHGRAYLVAPPASSLQAIDPSASPNQVKNSGNLLNTFAHKAMPRQLVTGAHTVCDISCTLCGAVLGWKYIAAEDEAQRYKVGKFILETSRVCKSVCWEGEGEGMVVEEGYRKSEEEFEFDSQDEDECEDLFSGVWSPALAKRRRRARLGRVKE
ncbi:yippee-domain-containing protein [Eremomyces bilateralis CBS 781.70]|uniref:Yippee-domain-containing protein n=1 Tax=Eremomyces bilateralis CBS 781.70 TaxID=1392243 RepID=A0A6G1FYG0_9PEZI|nr:yippee-domain-containing protein [Eremomyces bilateralis CBS 781.70]KAF1810905.1 yippee-domain-containing protein [Eremomyces bilateralis CBS 781.70]